MLVSSVPTWLRQLHPSKSVPEDAVGSSLGSHPAILSMSITKYDRYAMVYLTERRRGKSLEQLFGTLR